MSKVESSALRDLRTQMFANKGRLLAAFQSHDTEGTGSCNFFVNKFLAFTKGCRYVKRSKRAIIVICISLFLIT